MAAPYKKWVETNDGLTEQARAERIARLHLSPRLYRVLVRIVEGKSYRCIAAELGLRLSTMHVYATELRRAKCVESDIALTEWYIKSIQPHVLPASAPHAMTAGSGV